MDLTSWALIAGGAVAALLFLVDVFRPIRKNQAALAGYTGIVFLAGASLVPTCNLLRIVVEPATRKTFPPALNGYEIYIFLGGLVALVIAALAIISSYNEVWTTPAPP
jgi:hypothetical protein